MHEMSIARNIVEIVEEALRGDPGVRVERVTVRVGAMVAVAPDSLSFCYDAITEGTALAGSSLAIEEIPASVHCEACHQVSTVERFVFRCGHCGGTKLSMLTGNELMIGNIEVVE